MWNKSKKKKKVQEQETRVKLVYLLVLNVIFHPKKRNFKTFFFLQTAKMTVTVHRWFLLSRGKAEESSQIVSPNLVTCSGGFLQRAHAPRDTRSTKKGMLWRNRVRSEHFSKSTVMARDRIHLVRPFPKVLVCLLCFSSATLGRSS